MLWLLPSAPTAFVMGFEEQLPSQVYLWAGQAIDRDCLLIISSAILAVAAGSIWAAFKAESPKKPYGRRWREMALWALWFCVMQTLLVPTIAGIWVVATCALSFPPR
jgi:hypothetical protein